MFFRVALLAVLLLIAAIFFCVVFSVQKAASLGSASAAPAASSMPRAPSPPSPPAPPSSVSASRPFHSRSPSAGSDGGGEGEESEPHPPPPDDVDREGEGQPDDDVVAIVRQQLHLLQQQQREMAASLIRSVNEGMCFVPEGPDHHEAFACVARSSDEDDDMDDDFLLYRSSEDRDARMQAVANRFSDPFLFFIASHFLVVSFHCCLTIILWDFLSPPLLFIVLSFLILFPL